MTASTSAQFYIPESRQAFIKKIQAGLQQNKIVAVEGQVGIGKTVILEEVLTQTLPDANKCYITANHALNDIQIRSRIIEQLFGNVLFDPEMPLLTSFIEFNQPSEILIAIDNSHFLSGRIIGELLQLFSESRNLGINLTLVIAFDKSISSTLLNVNSAFLMVLTVPTLSKQESYQLLAQYIVDIPAQTNNKVKRWIENSAGLPIQLLAYGDDKASNLVDNNPFNIKLWGSILVLASLVLALGMYVYRMDIKSQEQKQEVVTGVQPSIQKNQQATVVKPWQPSSSKAGSQSDVITTLDDEQSPIKSVIITPAATSKNIFDELMNPQQSQEKIKQDKEDIDKSKEPKINPTTDKILAELIQQPESEVDTNLLQEQDVLSNPLTSPSTDATKVKHPEPQVKETELAEPKGTVALSNSEKAISDEPQDDISMDFFLEPEESESAPIENKLKQDIDTNIVSTETEQPEPITETSLYNIDNQIFMSLPQDHYVLQLTAVSTEEVLAEYLLSSPVPTEQLRIYKIRRNQNDWIVVTYGLFETIEQARTAASSVAPNAWAKSILVIQQQITAYYSAQTNQ